MFDRTRSRRRLDTGWLFGGAVPTPGTVDKLNADVVRAYSESGLDDSTWQRVAVPHTVVPLSWQKWQPAEWEKVWAYRKHFDLPEHEDGERVFLDFEGVMTTATVTFNDTPLGEHRGGYLPFSFEVTDLVRASGNTLAVVVDSRFTINVPPNLPDPALSSSIDYWQPGGIHRDVWLRRVPPTFLASVETTHESVLDPAARKSTFVVSIDSSAELDGLELAVELLDSESAVIASTRTAITNVAIGTTSVRVELDKLDAVELWDINAPHLYTVVASLVDAGRTIHEARLRTGYREARFEKDGFYLNGTRRYLLGVNRHGYFPFTGFAMPDRVHRRDAEIIKRDLNCVMVRCSHYPQTESFLDACDELGLLVWEESPGWQYVGDASWREHAVSDIQNMIARDRHRPSVIVWGARLNETPDRPDFYARTEALVKSLDPSRATSGTMHGDYSRAAVFQHDVFSYDDYTTVIDGDGERRPVLLPPVEDRPYLISEGVSSRSSPTTLYRRTETAQVQQHQALDFAHAHNDAMGDRRFTGLLAWVGFDYQADMGNNYHGVKTSGLGDVFRILKPGAAIYRSQVSPRERIVVEPAFTWDPPEFGQADAYGGRPESKTWGPGAKAMICSNCDRLEVFLGEERVGTVLPDRESFPHLEYAPSFVDLTLQDHDSADLRIDGYLDDQLVVTRLYSGDRTRDSFTLIPDDIELVADGVDATRVTLAVVDRYRQPRGASRAIVHLEISGPGVLVGDNPFELEETGAVGAVWIRSSDHTPGPITLRAVVPGLGIETVEITSVSANATKTNER